MCAVLLVPLLLVDVPPLLDYPNHLARLFVLARLPGDAVLARFYAPAWSLVPDLGIDLVGPPLIRVLPVHVAGRIILGVVLLLPVLGAIAYARAAGTHPGAGRSWWTLGVGLVAYNETFLLGFLNFTVSMGLSLLLAAHWLRWRETRPVRTWLISLPCVAGLYVCHLMGVVFFAILIGAHELARAIAWLRRGPWLRRGAWGVVVARCAGAGALFLPVLALHVRSPLAREAGGIVYPPLSQKLTQLLAPWTNYALALDVATALTVLALLGWLLVTRRVVVGVRAAITAVLLLAAYLAFPSAAAGAANIDLRLVILGGFLVFALPAPTRLPGWMGALLGGLFLGRMALLAAAWHGHAASVAALRAVIAPVPPGATVLVVDGTAPDGARRLSSGQVTDTHLPALILIECRAWWPFLFDNPSQQPIATRPPYQALALRIDARGAAAAMADTRGIDDVLVGDAALAVPAQWVPLAASGFGRLYRVRPE